MSSGGGASQDGPKAGARLKQRNRARPGGAGDAAEVSSPARRASVRSSVSGTARPRGPSRAATAQRPHQGKGADADDLEDPAKAHAGKPRRPASRPPAESSSPSAAAAGGGGGGDGDEAAVAAGGEEAGGSPSSTAAATMVTLSPNWEEELRATVASEVREATSTLLQELQQLLRSELATTRTMATTKEEEGEGKGAPAAELAAGLSAPSASSSSSSCSAPLSANEIRSAVSDAVAATMQDMTTKLVQIQSRLDSLSASHALFPSSGGGGNTGGSSSSTALAMTANAGNESTLKQNPFEEVPRPANEPYLGHEFRGVSVDYLATKLLDEMQYVGLSREAKVYEIETEVIRRKGENLVCPRDGKKGAAYIDCIYGPDNASLSTFMLSYTWGYRVGDIVDTLQQFCQEKKLDPKRTYAWVCCLCINQHRVKEKQAAGEVVPFEDFEKAFGERVAGIGKIVAMMAPWRDPFYLKRVWCDFEMYTATTLWSRDEIDKHVFIAMPPNEANDFRKALMSGGVGEVWKALGSVNVEAAEASVPEDKARILTLIRNGPGFSGINGMNYAVGQRLQAWIVQSSEGHFQERLNSGGPSDASLAQLGEEVGVLLKQVGELDRSTAALEAARKIRVKTSTLQRPEGANLLRNIGVVRAESGDDAGAMVAFKEALAIREGTGTLMTCDGARIFSNIGNINMVQGDQAAAFEAYGQAMKIRQEANALKTTEGALLMMNIGSLKRSQNDNQGALEAFKNAKTTREETGMLVTPDGARLLSSIADAHGAQGEVEEEVRAYEEARRILELTGTLETKDGALVLTNLGLAHGKNGNPKAELEVFELAKKVREKTGTAQTAEGKKLAATIHLLKMNAKKAAAKAKA